MDLVVLTTAKAGYLDDESWVLELGGLRVVQTRQWGPLTERRVVLPSGLEVEAGFAPPSWAATGPVEPGTLRVVRDGMRIIHDPRGLLARLDDACRRA